jgi:hypothetical protein
MLYVSKGDRLAFWFLLVLGLVGLFLAYASEMPWWPGIFFMVGAAALVLAGWLDDPRRYAVDDIDISAQGIRRTHGSRLWVKKVEAISWDALSRVEMVTDADDPDGKSFLLCGSDGTQIAVSDAQSEGEALLWQMAKRLPGFEEQRVEEANERTGFEPVVVWQESAPGPR